MREKATQRSKKVRLLCMLLEMIMLLSAQGIIVLADTVSGNTLAEDTNFANLVLYISFSDSTSDYWVGKGEEIDRLYNKTERYSALSVKDYFSIVSGGTMQLGNIMPQLSGDSDNHINIIPITLAYNAEHYASADSDYDLIQETITQLNNNSSLLTNIPEELDCDGDGYIDNVTFVVASPEVERDSNFYSHKANAAYYQLRIKGKLLNAYNVINYGNLSSAAGSAGVVAHELMHVLGPLDTYRICAESNGSCGEGPVGCWDIMAQTSAFLQYPLAYTRKELGWINIREVLTSGTYTLTSPQTDSDQYAMILKTPYSDTEFFVIEYRKQGSFYNESTIDKIDDKIGGSGIIVYRVNTAVSPKSNLTQDYIYVFRNGESEKTATSAKAREAVLSAESGRTSYGSSEMSATTEGGAITYTDGTNSGIVISNVGNAGGDSISFEIDYSIDLTDQCWRKESYRPAEIDYNSGVGLDVSMLNGTLYGSNVKTICYNGSLYGVYSNRSAKAELLRYENGQWKSVKVLTQDYSYDVDITVGEDGLLYIVAGAGDYSSLSLYCMDPSENITEITGSFSPSGNSVVNPKISACSEGIVIAYRDYQNNDTIHLFFKAKTGWREINTDTVITGNYFELCKNKESVYLVSACGNGNYVYHCNLAKTMTMSKYTPLYTANDSTAVELFADSYGTLYVAYYDTVRNAVLVQGYRDNCWHQIGMNVYNQMVSNIHAVAYGDTIYAAYEGSETKGIKSHKVLVVTEEKPVDNSTDNGYTDKNTEENNDSAKPDEIKIVALSITGISKKISAGKSIHLTPEIVPANASDQTLKWTSSNKKYATVSDTGKVSLKKAGAGKTVYITAETTDGSGIKATYQIKIMKHAVKKITLSASNKTVKAGKQLKIKATVTTTGKNANKTLKWTSSNTGYATVSKNGKVKTTKAGKGKTVTITAVSTDGSNKKAKIKIKIR